MYADRTINCLDCGTEFSFTAGEQEFYAQRGFTEAPKRCPGCRAARKQQRQASAGAMGNGEYGGGYSAGGGYSDRAYSAGYSSSGGGYGAEYRERPAREMFEAVCADCGRTASVPFRPSGARPVYCSDCFQARR